LRQFRKGRPAQIREFFRHAYPTIDLALQAVEMWTSVWLDHPTIAKTRASIREAIEQTWADDDKLGIEAMIVFGDSIETLILPYSISEIRDQFESLGMELEEDD
jgi:hypothetical protein